MAVGPKDHIDKLLVKKYSKEQVDNHSDMTSMIDPEKMMEVMNDYAMMHKNMNALNQKLKNVCYNINSISAKYRRSASAA